MLAGLQSQVDTLFPTLRGLVPDDETIRAGEDKLKSGRLVRLSGYKAEVFDMHDPKSRAAYARRMLDLSQRSQLGTVRILVHDRQTLHRKDGSSGWFGYLEWMEYDRVQDDADAAGKKEGSDGKAGNVGD